MKAGAEPVLKVGVTSSAAYVGDSLLGLDRAIVRLIEKLGPVLTPETPTGCNGTAGDCVLSGCSEVTTQLDKHARFVAELTDVVRRLTERVEL